MDETSNAIAEQPVSHEAAAKQALVKALMGSGINVRADNIMFSPHVENPAPGNSPGTNIDMVTVYFQKLATNLTEEQKRWVAKSLDVAMDASKPATYLAEANTLTVTGTMEQIGKIDTKVFADTYAELKQQYLEGQGPTLS